MIVAGDLTPAVIGLIVGAPSIALGYLGYRRSQRVDRIAERASTATQGAATADRAVAGLSALAERLQEDNTALRAELHAVNEKLDQVVNACEELKRQLAALRNGVRDTPS